MVAHLGEGQLRTKTTAALRPHPFLGKAKGVNPDKKSGVGAPKAVRHATVVPAAPATSLLPSCIGSAVPLDQPAAWRGEICSLGNCESPKPTRPGSVAPRLFPLNTVFIIIISASPQGETEKRGVAVTGYKLNPIDVGYERQGPLPTVGEVIAPHWTATARHKLGSPQPIRCCPVNAHLPHWVRGA
jgi:hypothetical protein